MSEGTPILSAGVVAIFLALSHADSAGAATLSAEPYEFFEKRIRPVLVERCYECHSAQATKLKGGLLLDTHAGLLKGGDSGAAIVPHSPDQSLLLQALRY